MNIVAIREMEWSLNLFFDKLHDLPTNANPIPLPSRSFFVDLLYQYGSLHEMAPDLNCASAGIQFADDQ